MIAQHLVPDLPVQILVGRRVEQLFDPCREQRFVGAVPAIAHLPDASDRNPKRLRLAGADGNLAGHRAAIPRLVARQGRAPGAGGGGCDFGEPGIRWPLVPVGRFDSSTSVGRDQRQHALYRLFGDDHDAQRRAGPGRQRRRQHGDFGRSRAAARCRCGRGWRHCKKQQEKSVRDQQACRRGGSWAARKKHFNITLLKHSEPAFDPGGPDGTIPN